ncbi:MAG: family 43 glycosylhydrolase [Paludibacteraceae bacterium]|nr:family 43 glycosylhydrolase [Paludibacteraceae bacterium]
MRKTLLNVVASIATLFGAALQSFGVTVSNPIIYSDVPDPSVIRDGNKYYMVSTTMHCAPGVPIMMSEDLSNWRTVNYAYQTLDNGDNQNLNAGKHAYGKGSWASSLRKHKNKYYILTPSYTTGKTHLFSTDDIENGTWDEVRLPFYHDPSLFFDDDDRAYIIYGGGEFNVVELNSDLKSVKNGVTKLNIPIDQTTGTNSYIVKCEGAHMEKIDGKYYLFAISWPGGKCRTELVFRSSSLKGNYEGRIALQENGVAQGSVFDTPDGKWYAMLFRDSGGVGRIPWLIPVTWENGWPNMGKQAARTLNLPNAVEPAYSMATSDDFESTTLPLEWQWNHNPDNSKWSLSARPGFLRITTGRTDKSLYWAKNTLTQKTFGPKCSGRVALDVKGMKDGDVAGLVALQDSFGFVGVEKQWGKYNIVQNKTVTRNASVPLNADRVYLRIDFDFTKDRAYFFYSTDNQKWNSIGKDIPLPYTLGMFAGYKFGLFNYATSQTGGYADFDWFKVGEDVNDEIYLDAIKEPEVVGPYNESAAQIPGVVETENYNTGGNNISYYDKDRSNRGGEYRKDGVDIYATDEANGFAIGYCEADEWLNYTINVAEEGEYVVTVRASEEGEVEAGTIHATLTDNVNGSSIDIEIGSTGDWDVYGEFPQANRIKLPAGESTLELTIKKSWVNIDRLSFAKWDPTDIAMTDADKITVVATPSTINIIGIDEPFKAEIINAEGKIIMSRDARTRVFTEISTSGFASGIYTVRITTENAVVCKKITLK